MINTPKVVVSRSLAESPWANAVVANDLVATIIDLKARPGGDLIAYGRSTLATALIAEGLVDNIYLFVNPTAIGAGLPVFGVGAQRLDLAEAVGFACGITALHYVPTKAG